jgi:hypothetical protein
VDLSEKRLCEVRCLGTLDDMNNWVPGKYLLAEGDTYAKYPDDETYPHLLVNYVKLDKLPGPDDSWVPVTKSLRAGTFFVTSGEVLIHHVAVEGTKAVNAEIEWTYPLEFVEAVWGDGKTTGSQVLSATDKTAFGRAKFRIPVDLAGQKWVRFAAWDAAGNGAISQPAVIGR